MLSQTIADFATLAIAAGGWMEMDRLYLHNRILGMIGENQLEEFEVRPVTRPSTELLDELIKTAQANQVIDTTLSAIEILEGELMDFLTPPPSVVNAFFAQHYAKKPKEATDYFFELCKNNDYIKTRAIAKNIYFPVQTSYGELEITINLSKPEKDPKQIAAERTATTSHYPKCMLCMENEGYQGRVNYPARTNHRIIRMNLAGESWGFQYSPYAYYNEHCIILSEEHRPMEISSQTFERLLQIVEVLPHYFAGSNADLPIVGGSILSHDHYQGGNHTFAMAEAPIEHLFALKDFPTIVAGTVQWPMSVIRLQATDKEQLIAAASHVLANWRTYSVPELDIVAFSEDGTLHHTITPIARKKGEFFELDLVLRDNNVSEEYPDGIFHPHQDVHHIKKENIGLIEVMGLAILPPRLEKELQEVEKFLLNQENHLAESHRIWAERMKVSYTISEENVRAIMEKEIGQIFIRVLEDAGVFKRDEQGQQAFIAFTQTL
ncbi:galactose-1-phosphate uridylyltransferase [Enterococcus sp. DIV2402]|uniref:Galactose-1-phosphate uridylyltransferase n=1 Tax=Candidatus Enterococcus lowellii TaxID=2230877 RepID=A0ABZ2STM2_9ENTE|nr:UDP-glucose--hexose-1-phosphate uridylyltransferase [Enterococcus sp. DIV2402]MBO0463446.1 UDP-glucose--hexose-1-phosphate uridylyltransferase [Enterococcus sp. DIV2402]